MESNEQKLTATQEVRILTAACDASFERSTREMARTTSAPPLAHELVIDDIALMPGLGFLTIQSQRGLAADSQEVAA